MPDRNRMLDHTTPRRLKLFGLVALGVAFIIVCSGLVSRALADRQLATWTAAEAIPTVSVMRLSDSGRDGALVLPGDVEAFYAAPVHARVTGYLKRWYTDIGAPVKAGQVLAEIDTPDLDQQLAQAQANLATAEANQKLADITASRWKALFAENAVAAQAVDEKVGALNADIAISAAARASTKQLMAEEAFKKIIAPFDGVVTSRSTDIGALITVGTPTDVPLFTVADEHRVRIYVHVPQSYSALVKPGMTATFTVPQFPGRKFVANVAATAEAVDPQSGTQLAEFQADNADRALKPGDYAQVQFSVPSRTASLLVPASAMMFRDNGMFVATVDSRDRVVMKRVAIDHDLGPMVEISGGLLASDSVVTNPPDSLRSGDVVRVASAASARARAQDR